MRRIEPDHPRVGGEHIGELITVALQDGSSPRRRGTRIPVPFFHSNRRIIPAWAGNTTTHRASVPAATDHPRVGGEHGGSKAHRTRVHGSSPRGRGTRRPERRADPQQRIIPAWAGNTRVRKPTISRSPDHPRVGGEHNGGHLKKSLSAGSSPRGRGTLEIHQFVFEFVRIIPAWAGNTDTEHLVSGTVSDHPRVGGEHEIPTPVDTSYIGSSPRGRGTRVDRDQLDQGNRIIPAWAGNTMTALLSSSVASDHPRVGGEHGS